VGGNRLEAPGLDGTACPRRLIFWGFLQDEAVAPSRFD